MAKVYLPDLMRRLDTIYTKCGGNQDESSGDADDEGLDEFGRLKKAIVKKLSELRKMIKERDEADPEDKKKVIKLRQSIRKDLTTVKEDVNKFNILFQKLSRKKNPKKMSAEEADIMAKRKEQADLVNSHLREVEQLERRFFADKVRAAAGADAGNGISGKDKSALFKSVPGLQMPGQENGK